MAANTQFLRIALLAMLTVGIGVLASPAAKARGPVKSLLEMRQERTVIQEWDLSCGAAALATLLNYQHGDRWSGSRKLSPTPGPGSQARLLPPSPLRTARTGFPISSSSLSNARCRTRLANGYTQVVNLAMAFGM